jgi:hypothetical protein
MGKNIWTAAELRKFDKLTEACSSQNGNTRVIARLDLKRFVEEVGKEKCDAMFAHLTERDKKRGRQP